MTEPIKVGDLVVVGPPRCCGSTTTEDGIIFHVTGLFENDDSNCVFCQSRRSGFLAVGWRGGYVRANRLKRIPPLSELDDVKRDEEITA